MSASNIHAVTGAFGFSGRYITKRLLERGERVITLTNSSPKKHLFPEEIEVHPFGFDHPGRLTEVLRGVSVLYNTYWVRFNYHSFNQAQALQNMLTLFSAAKEVGVQRVVHISITNPSLDSPFEYFRGKARMEQALIDSGIPYAILRPAVLFGKEDILINNIAWALRHLPVFGVFGDGQYRLQPIFVDDLAHLAAEQGDQRERVIINAIGPETFTYRQLVHEIGEIIGVRRPILSVPPSLGYLTARALGLLMGDVMLTRAEVEGLMANLLYVDAQPAGATKLTDWARANSQELGRKYASELARRKG